MRSKRLIFALWAQGLAACASAPDNVWDDRASTDDGSQNSDETPAKGAESEQDAGRRDGGRASAGSAASGPGSSTSSGASGSGSASKDAGKSTSTSAGSIRITQGDASVSSPLDAITDLLGGLGGTSASGGGATKPQATTTDGGVDHCAELVCFDVFDCALWHGDALDCGFTKCEGFVCAK